MSKTSSIRVNEQSSWFPISVTWPNGLSSPLQWKILPKSNGDSSTSYVLGEEFYQESHKGDKKHPTPYFYRLSRRKPAMRKEKFVHKNEGSWYETFKVSNAPISFDMEFFESKSELEALKKLYAKINAMDFNLAQAVFVEGKDNISLLRNAFSQFGKLNAATKKLLKTDPLKVTADTWLEYSLGWRPLANDLYNLMSALGQNPLLNGDTFSITGSGKDTMKKSEKIDFYDMLTKKEHKVKFKVEYRIKNIALFNQRRLGILNPAYLAWQYTNLSFVVDWFYDVSGLLQTLEGAIGAGLEFISGQKADLHCNFRYLYGDISYGYDFQKWTRYYSGLWPVSRSIEGSSEFIEFRRTVLTGFPVPSLPKFDIGGIDGPAKAATAASLIAQALNHGRK